MAFAATMCTFVHSSIQVSMGVNMVCMCIPWDMGMHVCMHVCGYISLSNPQLIYHLHFILKIKS